MSRCFEILFGGAKGGGKTEAGLAWLTYDSDHPLLRGLVIREHAGDLEDWIDRAGTLYRGYGVQIVGRPAELRFPKGAVIRTGHLKDEHAYTKYLGHEYQRILIEELTLIERLIDYLKLISACRSTVPGLRAQVFATTNPGGPGHGWVKERFIDVSSPGKKYIDPETGRSRIFIPAKITDNPTLMKYDPTYVNFLNSLPEDTKRAWRDGDWDIVEGQFFSKFRKQIHVMEGEVYKYRELLVHETRPKVVAENILALSEGDGNIGMWVGDTNMWMKNPFAGGIQDTMKAYSDKSIADAFMAAGIPLLQANKNRMMGWLLLKTLMEWEGIFDGERGDYVLSRKPRLHIFSICRETIKAYPEQLHDTTKPGDMKKKDGDDPPDSDRYTLMHLMEGVEPVDEEKRLKEEYVAREKRVIYAEETKDSWMDS